MKNKNISNAEFLIKAEEETKNVRGSHINLIPEIPNWVLNFLHFVFGKHN